MMAQFERMLIRGWTPANELSQNMCAFVWGLLTKAVKRCTSDKLLGEVQADLRAGFHHLFSDVHVGEIMDYLQETRYNLAKRDIHTDVLACRVLGAVESRAEGRTTNAVERMVRTLVHEGGQKTFGHPTRLFVSITGRDEQGGVCDSLAENITYRIATNTDPPTPPPKLSAQWASAAAAYLQPGHVVHADSQGLRDRGLVYVKKCDDRDDSPVAYNYPTSCAFANAGVISLSEVAKAATAPLFARIDNHYFEGCPSRPGFIRVLAPQGRSETSDLVALWHTHSACQIAARMLLDDIPRDVISISLGRFVKKYLQQKKIQKSLTAAECEILAANAETGEAGLLASKLMMARPTGGAANEFDLDALYAAEANAWNARLRRSQDMSAGTEPALISTAAVSGNPAVRRDFRGSTGGASLVAKAMLLPCTPKQLNTNASKQSRRGMASRGGAAAAPARKPAKKPAKILTKKLASKEPRGGHAGCRGRARTCFRDWERNRTLQSSGGSDGGTDESEEVDETYDINGSNIRCAVMGVHANSELYMRVRWPGFGANDDTWEPASNLECKKRGESMAMYADNLSATHGGHPPRVDLAAAFATGGYVCKAACCSWQKQHPIGPSAMWSKLPSANAGAASLSSSDDDDQQAVERKYKLAVMELEVQPEELSYLENEVLGSAVTVGSKGNELQEDAPFGVIGGGRGRRRGSKLNLGARGGNRGIGGGNERGDRRSKKRRV
jgi:hypothetical protein